MKKLLLSVLLLFLLVGLTRAAQPELLINEINWMGNEGSWADEWIELYNSSDKKINLEKWKLTTADESLSIDLKGAVKPNSFFILERTDDGTLPEIEADQIYTGGLNNGGQYLKLIKDGQVIQEINDKAGWRAGNKSDYKTMERGEEGWHTSRKEGGTPGKRNGEPVSKEEQMPAKPLTSSLNQGYSDFWFTLMVALGMSIFSAAIIYVLKRELRKVENKEQNKV